MSIKLGTYDLNLLYYYTNISLFIKIANFGILAQSRQDVKKKF